MKCECGKDAVIVSREIPRCEPCFIRFFERRTRRTMRNSISPNDFVGVAVSGGSDSLSVLHLMKKFLKKKPVAIIVDEGIKGYRGKTIECAKNYCKKSGIPYKIFTFKDEYGITTDRLQRRINTRAHNAVSSGGAS